MARKSNETLSKKIPVMYAFARSGGTLINQILGASPQCLVLSEINPAGSVISIETQASEWLDLLRPEEVKWFKKLTYVEKISFLSEKAKKAKKVLVIRDWPTLNFLPGIFQYPIDPSELLEQQLYLESHGFLIQSFVICRRSDRVFESIQKNFQHLKELKIEIFSDAYLNYAKSASFSPVFQLEKLCQNPKQVIAKILSTIQLNEDVGYLLSNFYKFQKCTGNNSLGVPSLSSQAKDIFIDIGNGLPGNVFRTDKMKEADKLFGYE